ncbi:MAG: hypothetical protein KAU49_03305 [Candidatus Krumholzibacteria bacterium]|nr:hypothetical protein [Candidatus Krumholzibacteria bacterium]
MEDEKKHTTAIPPGIAAAASYFFPFLGGLVMLAVEKEDRLVRFHAAQSIVFWVCVMILAALIGWIPVINVLFSIVFIAVWIFLMYQAWTNKEFEIPYLGAIARKQVFGEKDSASVEEKPEPAPEASPGEERPAADDGEEGPRV